MSAARLISDPSPVDTATQWFADYLCRPHPLLGRDGAVCPFVAPALKAGSVVTMERKFAADIGIEGMVATVHDMAESFETADWPEHGEPLRALVWVLTGIPDEKLHLLDDAQGMTKTDLVRRGFILGQFYPHCPETAIRNPGFPVARAPVAMFGLRRMAFHDVLFLHSDPDWFAAYQERFGDRYTSGSVTSPALHEKYEQAQSRWNR
jgi:heptaprenyl diphosphate synthase